MLPFSPFFDQYLQLSFYACPPLHIGSIGGKQLVSSFTVPRMARNYVPWAEHNRLYSVASSIPDLGDLSWCYNGIKLLGPWKGVNVCHMWEEYEFSMARVKTMVGRILRWPPGVPQELINHVTQKFNTPIICFLDLADSENGLLNSQRIIVNFYISPCSFVNNYFRLYS